MGDDGSEDTEYINSQNSAVTVHGPLTPVTASNGAQGSISILTNLAKPAVWNIAPPANAENNAKTRIPGCPLVLPLLDASGTARSNFDRNPSGQSLPFGVGMASSSPLVPQTPSSVYKWEKTTTAMGATARE